MRKLLEIFISILKNLKQPRSNVVPTTTEKKSIVEEQVPAENSSLPSVDPSTEPSTQNQEWHIPVPAEYFISSQAYLEENWQLYPKFGHHTGVDYGGHGKTGIPLFACANGEIVYREIADSPWGASLGNHAALYVSSIDKSFLYCHMAEGPHILGPVKSGEQIGVMGNTGKSAGRAIHLHLEGFLGRFRIPWRSFASLDDIKTKTFDADQLIRSCISK